MALLGHSGSQAPQLMHASVILMAILLSKNLGLGLVNVFKVGLIDGVGGSLSDFACFLGLSLGGCGLREPPGGPRSGCEARSEANPGRWRPVAKRRGTP
jgi:hypothetical protein